LLVVFACEDEEKDCAGVEGGGHGGTLE